jgi:type IV fimbrial biogenesis protein FimT
MDHAESQQLLRDPQGRHVLTAAMPRYRGFSLIELMIALAIAVTLLVLAAPSYGVWVADSRIRAAADSIAGGLRLAQAEAVKRNEDIEFVLDPTTDTGGWTLSVVATPATAMPEGSFAEGARLTQFTVAPAGGTTVTFTGLGTIRANNADGTAPFEQITIAPSTGVAGTRNLRVLIGAGRTGIKICDPQWTVINADDPKACPTP